jgi:hypothetical protein
MPQPKRRAIDVHTSWQLGSSSSASIGIWVALEIDARLAASATASAVAAPSSDALEITAD